MVVLVTCKNEEDSIKNEGTRVLTRLYMYVDFSDTQRAANSAVSGNSISSKLLWLSSLPARMK